MNKKKVLNLLSMCIGLMIILFSPMIGNSAELHSIYENITRSYFTYIAYTISFSVLGLAIFLSGVIGYYMNDKK
jgi:hypothetical protein